MVQGGRIDALEAAVYADIERTDTVLMKMRILLAALATVLCLPALAQSQLFLVGGSLKTCGSYSPSNCIDGVRWSDSAKTGKMLSVTPDKILMINNLPLWQGKLAHDKTPVLKVLAHFHKLHGEDTNSSKEFKRRLKKIATKLGGDTIDGKKLIDRLPDHLYYAVQDILEAKQVLPDGGFRLEQASAMGSKTPGSRAIYQAYIDAVKRVTPEGQQPTVLVSTASGYDPYGAVDFYLAVFRDLGARALWLPVEATMGKLFDEGGCKNLETARQAYLGVYNRAGVYPYLASQQQEFCENPDKLVDLAQQANGIFFNGGDQSLTWQAFVDKNEKDRPYLAALRKKFDAGKLIISGTSAGTAVQSGALGGGQAGMITGGTSDGALIMGAQAKPPWIERSDPETKIRPVTYHGGGGLKFFPYGVMDTHFSERGRQLRLAKLVLESEARLGFGVDETTALVVTPVDEGNAEFTVVGQNGVYVVEQDGDSRSDKNTLQFRSHYLVNGQTFSLRDGRLELPPEQFSASAGWSGEVSSAENLNSKAHYRDLVQAQIEGRKASATAAFEASQRKIVISILFDDQAMVSKESSHDGFYGYADVMVKASVKE